MAYSNNHGAVGANPAMGSTQIWIWLIGIANPTKQMPKTLECLGNCGKNMIIYNPYHPGNMLLIFLGGCFVYIYISFIFTDSHGYFNAFQYYPSKIFLDPALSAVALSLVYTAEFRTPSRTFRFAAWLWILFTTERPTQFKKRIVWCMVNNVHVCIYIYVCCIQ